MPLTDDTRTRYYERGRRAYRAGLARTDTDGYAEGIGDALESIPPGHRAHGVTATALREAWRAGWDDEARVVQVPASDLVAGDLVQIAPWPLLPRRERTVSHVTDSGWVNGRGEPILTVHYLGGAYGGWSAGNTWSASGTVDIVRPDRQPAAAT